MIAVKFYWRDTLLFPLLLPSLFLKVSLNRRVFPLLAQKVYSDNNTGSENQCHQKKEIVLPTCLIKYGAPYKLQSLNVFPLDNVYAVRILPTPALTVKEKYCINLANSYN